ncbi:uncharacterized protein LOC129944801 [Eupeodes corollae]|uniref:uncharacterized protein LOC129944801 n=1 Tax=Eupeodes corollae TaxID=290404 RepID=UPI00248F6A16|nr:uncharacterized protein LOC129944801 [Eupeodes corollae]
MAPKTGNVIASKRIKNLYEIKASNERENITVLMTFSADRRTLPPMVVLPYKRSPNWLKSVQNKKLDWVLGKTESGWMRGETFLQYVKDVLKVLISKNDVKRPVLFFVDGHASHMSLELSNFCSSNIILYALPPNTTHILQPADVGDFKGIKSDYKNILNEWCKRPGSHGSTMNKKNFCDVLEELLNYKDRTTIIQNAFKKCGLFPFAPYAVDYSKCIQNALEPLNATVSDLGGDVRGPNVEAPDGVDIWRVFWRSFWW